MVPVATHHATHVVDRDILPGLVADVLPAGDFLKHEQADLVAGIEKVTRLRIVRCAHDIAVELLAQDLRITTLHPTRHRLANERKCLMAIETAQLDDLAVQREALIGEGRFAEA